MRAFTMPVMICGIAATMVVMIWGSAWMSDTSRSIPAWMICGMEFNTAVMIPSMICGMAATMAVMMSGRAATSEVRSWMPVSMIWGMEFSRKVTIPLMISGKAAMSTGRALRMPWASPVTSCRAASRMRGRLAIRVWQICTTICTMVGTS